MNAVTSSAVRAALEVEVFTMDASQQEVERNTMPKTITLTDAQEQALREKLEWLMREANGVDIWLAPGGTLDVNNDEDGGTECFLDCDEEAHYRLNEIVQMLGGPFLPHRDEEMGFKPPLEPIITMTHEQYATVVNTLAGVSTHVEQGHALTVDDEVFKQLDALLSQMSAVGIEKGVDAI